MAKYQKSTLNLMVVYVLTLALNYLSAIGFLNGFSQKEISNRYHTLVTPAPTAFSIWTVIYLLIAAVLIRAYFSKADYFENQLKPIYPFLMGTLLLNGLWTILFTANQIALSFLVILLYLILLIIILVFLQKLGDKQSLLKVTFGIETGWLLVASLVNGAALFQKNQWNTPLLSGFILVVLLVIVAGFAFYLVKKVKNSYIFLSIAWATYFIYLSNVNHSHTFNTLLVGFVSIILTVLMAVAFLYFTYRFLKNPY